MIQPAVNADLILRLILQDMRQRRFILSLEKIGFDAGNHYLDIGRVVAGLMGMQDMDVPDEWMDAYALIVDMAATYPMDGTGDLLRPFVQLCYDHMRSISGI